MRTSLIELQQIEAYIFDKEGNSLPESSVAYDSELSEKVMWQKETYAMVHRYGRNKLKDELAAVHNRLFSESRYAKFRRQVMRLFR